MPYQAIRKNTEIIVFDEAWRLVDYDKISVPGIIYMSFTETKLNEMTDDLHEQLANVDRQQAWSINAPDKIYLSVGDVLKIDYTISKDGIIKNEDVNPEFALGDGFIVNKYGEIIADKQCETLVTLSYKNALKTVLVSIGKAKPAGFITGNDYIRITKTSEYEFVMSGVQFNEPLNFISSNEELATVLTQGYNTCKVITNKKNKLGTFTLSVIYDGVKYEKEIKIISLWQEV